MLQGPPLGIDIMYLALADRNMQVRFGLKVVQGVPTQTVIFHFALVGRNMEVSFGLKVI